MAAEAEDGENWAASGFRMSLRDALVLQALCRARPGTAGYDEPFESELGTWLVSRWQEAETVVVEVGLRTEEAARGVEEDEESGEGLDLMIRTTAAALAAFGDQVAAGVEFTLGPSANPKRR